MVVGYHHFRKPPSGSQEIVWIIKSWHLRNRLRKRNMPCPWSCWHPSQANSETTDTRTWANTRTPTLDLELLKFHCLIIISKCFGVSISISSHFYSKTSVAFWSAISLFKRTSKKKRLQIHAVIESIGCDSIGSTWSCKATSNVLGIMGINMIDIISNASCHIIFYDIKDIISYHIISYHIIFFLSPILKKHTKKKSQAYCLIPKPLSRLSVKYYIWTKPLGCYSTRSCPSQQRPQCWQASPGSLVWILLKILPKFLFRKKLFLITHAKSVEIGVQKELFEGIIIYSIIDYHI